MRRLTVDYRRHGAGPGSLRAVDDLSFDLVPGKILALVGESGSGKSTVIRALSGFVAPTDGLIAVDGMAGLRGRRARQAYRSTLQLVFQDPFASLNPTSRPHGTSPRTSWSCTAARSSSRDRATR